jgi:hypothetical protein
MTVSFPIHPAARPFRIEHERVCARCGHGESLHPLRDLACLVCDQRVSLGMASACCVGVLESAAVSVTRTV